MRTVVRYGWTPDLPDARDLKLPPRRVHAPTPSKIDLRNHGPVIYDQGNLGSCTANAIAAAIQFDMIKQKQKVFRPSRLFIYYNERVIEDTVAQDSGAQLRDGAKTVAKLGVCDEEGSWPYDESKLTDRPWNSAYAKALDHQTLLYARVPQTALDLEGCLADGFPFVFGFTVYQSFESDSVALTGIVPMPNIKANEGVVGGHAVMAVGYDKLSRVFICRNSWGIDWGMKGYFTMPYDYVLNSDFSDDFWTFRKVE